MQRAHKHCRSVLSSVQYSMYILAFNSISPTHTVWCVVNSQYHAVIHCCHWLIGHTKSTVRETDFPSLTWFFFYSCSLRNLGRANWRRFSIYMYNSTTDEIPSSQENTIPFVHISFHRWKTDQVEPIIVVNSPCCCCPESSYPSVLELTLVQLF